MNDTDSHQDQITKARRGAPDAGKYFRYMAEFVGFRADDERAIVATRPIIEKHLPKIIADFYDHLLRYPPTRKFFLNQAGEVDQEYLELRMRHNANFWLRTLEGNYDDTYAGYVDYVGRAHTTHGADPSIYIPERYVIGQVGFMQHALGQAITEELRDKDEEFEDVAVEAWDKLMMVILELLSRAYGNEREQEKFEPLVAVDSQAIAALAAHSVEHEMPSAALRETKRVTVARADDIPDGERKIVTVDGISIGVFHQGDTWSALRNSCLHRGGPVATGKLEGDILTCPWHGFQYDVCDGHLLVDPKSHLDTFKVMIENGDVVLEIPQ
jgi:nitrite reductase/ring-hydroxylating ferredoxin subunit/hemoglobin-like flavoprotein